MKKQALGLTISVALLALIVATAARYLSILDPRWGIWVDTLPAVRSGRRVLHLRGLEGEVLVVWDRWGVPHIFASSEHDLAFAFGYVQAMDRLWQMDLERRLASGRMAELLGEDAFEVDLFFRAVDLRRGAEAIMAELEAGRFPELKAALEAFSAGVNAAMEDMERSGTLPVEYKLLGVKPEPWKPLDTLLVDRLICWGLTGDFDSIYLYKLLEGLQDAFGDEKGYEAVKSLLPPDRPIDEYIIPPGGAVGPAAPSGCLPSSGTQRPVAAAKMTIGSPEGLARLLAWWEKAMSYCSFVQGFEASNNWVVSGALTASGKPILCNDPHLALNVPPTWYEAHLVVRSGEEVKLNVRGVAFPGVPIIIIGRNDHVAWGFTNVGADAIDFYYYVWRSRDEYWYGPEGRWLKVERVSDTIRVRQGGKLVAKHVTLNYTVHGPLIVRWGVRMAVKWLGHYATFEAEALRRYNWARNLEDFVEALRFFQLPAQNHVYADVEGNIAWWACGRYPNRTNLDRSDPLRIWLPYNGSAGEGEWNEDDWIDPPDEVPHLVNPPWGYIVTANNRPASTADYSLVYEIGWTWADYYRARRIRELLEGLVANGGKLTPEDMKTIQNDVFSIPAREFLPYLLDALEAHAVELEVVEREAVEVLASWDYYMRADEAAPTLFAAWLQKLVDAVFNDEFSRAGLEDVKVPISMLEYFVKHPEAGAWWFDDKDTPDVEDRDTIMVRAFKEAVEELRRTIGIERTHPPRPLPPSEWKWGRVHRLKAQHVMGSVLPWLNYPRLSLDGWRHCVNNLGGLDVDHGPSWRQIVDLGGESWCVIPGGQSGNPFSSHYADQLELWASGRYKAMELPERPGDVSEPEALWRLKPKG